MKYSIKRAEAFSVVGLQTELTQSKKQNMQISTAFWRSFNARLAKHSLKQNRNWLKYAFTKREKEQLLYMCAIPKRDIVREGFQCLEIPAMTYLVVEHHGPMKQLYDTYDYIYKQLLPQSGYTQEKQYFLHFERYDERFAWNKIDSILEIWIPLQEGKKEH